MALRDPGMLEFARLVDTEELAADFARENGLLLSDQQIPPVQGQNSCALGTFGCNGTVHNAKKRRAEFTYFSYILYFLLFKILVIK